MTAVVKGRGSDTLNKTRGKVLDIDSRTRGCKLQLGERKQINLGKLSFFFAGQVQPLLVAGKTALDL